jgi:hypothetical protein
MWCQSRKMSIGALHQTRYETPPNPLLLATSVYVHLSFLRRWPGAPDQDRSDSGSRYHAKTQRLSSESPLTTGRCSRCTLRTAASRLHPISGARGRLGFSADRDWRNLFEVDDSGDLGPKVAAGPQPWAGGRNPFGIFWGWITQSFLGRIGPAHDVLRWTLQVVGHQYPGSSSHGKPQRRQGFPRKAQRRVRDEQRDG